MWCEVWDMRSSFDNDCSPLLSPSPPKLKLLLLRFSTTSNSTYKTQDVGTKWPCWYSQEYAFLHNYIWTTMMSEPVQNKSVCTAINGFSWHSGVVGSNTLQRPKISPTSSIFPKNLREFAFEKMGPVKAFWGMWHWSLVKHVMERGYSS